MPSLPGTPGPIQSLLQADHDRLDALLHEALAEPGRIAPAPFAAFRSGLLRHISMEEKILLPAARRARGGEQVEGFERIRSDHARLVSLLVPTPTPELIAELQAILAPHNRFEEQPDGIYARCEALLEPEAEALLERLRQAPEVPVRPHQDRIAPAGRKP